MIKRHFLEFEKPLEEISDKIDALEIVSKDNPELRSQIDKLQLEFEDRTKKIYSNLSRWNKVLISRHPQRPHTSDYIENISNNEINYGICPAGTGKTYLAVALAVDHLLNEKVDRIILIRPAVEAGEKLGFLPGDLSQKVDPYLRPLYDALYEMLGVEKTEKLLERGIVEIAPLAYMRGRTLNNSFIIVDESQNTTKEQMKMVLTRMGFGSYLVINGDLTQIDLPKNIKSGLSDAIEVLKDTDGIGFTNFSSSDVVRHPLVKKIIDAYKYFEDKLGL